MCLRVNFLQEFSRNFRKGFDVNAFRLRTLKRSLIFTALMVLSCWAQPSSSYAGNGNQIVYGKMVFFTGDAGESLSGTTGFNLGFQTYNNGNSTFRWFTGAEFGFASGSIRFSAGSRSSTLIGGLFKVGGTWSPFSNSSVHSLIEIAPVIGAQLLSVNSPPTGVDSNGVGFSYGASLTAGVDFNLSTSFKLRTFFEYQYLKGANLAGQNPFDLNAFSFGLGYLF